MSRMPPILAVLALIAGCASPPARPVDSSLARLASDQPQPATAPTDSDPIAGAAVDLQSLFDELDRRRHEIPANPPEHIYIPPQDTGIQIAAAEPEEPTPAPPPAPIPADADPDPAIVNRPEKSLDEQIEQTSVLLVDLLRQAAANSPDPLQAHLALAALEGVRPGAMPQLLTPDSSDDSLLAPGQRLSAETFRDFVRDMLDTPAGRGDLPALQHALQRLADRVRDAQPISIAHARLCARVESYGQFMPFSSTRFASGRSQRAVVYAELDHFAHRPVRDGDLSADNPARAGDRWAVDLSLELNLYHDADSLLAWRRPEQRVLETSRNRRRDFYLVSNITLPPTLTIGRYSLKITVRDKTTGALAEAAIPIEIVSDSILALERARSGD